MSATAPLAQKRGFPTSAKVVIAVLAVIAVVAVAVAVFAGRGTTAAAPSPAPVTPPLTPAPIPSPASTATATQPPTTPANTNVANGCLGGTADLDQAVLTAQKEAPITPVGAAEFAATLMRWATTAPAPAQQRALSSQILTPTATAAARGSLSNTVADEQIGYTVSLSFVGAHYIVTAFSGNTATVEWSGTGGGSHDGVSYGTATFAGTLVLSGSSTGWRLQDYVGKSGLSASQQQSFIDTLTQSGTLYAGGC